MSVIVSTWSSIWFDINSDDIRMIREGYELPQFVFWVGSQLSTSFLWVAILFYVKEIKFFKLFVSFQAELAVTALYFFVFENPFITNRSKWVQIMITAGFFISQLFWLYCSPLLKSYFKKLK